jgi:deoxyadenosine/deoxycytidine kinase/DNA-binding XRE family transcriptional regulator
LDNSTISQIESGEYRLSVELLEKIAKALGKATVFFFLQDNQIALPQKILDQNCAGLTIGDFFELQRQRQKNNFVYLVVTGNIGVGKSAIMQLLADRFNGEIFLESEANNPFLENYYLKMKQYAFQSQMYFIAESLKQHVKIEKSSRSAIQDRSIHEQCGIFAPALFEQGIIDENEFQVITSLYENIKNYFLPPSLVIYLRASTKQLLNRIKGRGRSYESGITEEYLGVLNKKHDEWIKNFSLSKTLTVETDSLDIVHIPAHWRNFIAKVESSL